MKTGRALTVLLSCELNISESDFLHKVQNVETSSVSLSFRCLMENVDDVSDVLVLELLKKKK